MDEAAHDPAPEAARLSVAAPAPVKTAPVHNAPVNGGLATAAPAPVERRGSRLRSRAVVPLLGAFAALLLICGIAIDMAISNQHAFDRVAHERAVDEALGEVQDAMLTAEASQRGYLMTGRAPYLTPYNDAAAQIAPAMQRLTGLVGGDPYRLALVSRLRNRLEQKSAEMARTIALARAGQPERALQLVNSDLGLNLSAGIIADLAELQHDVRERRDAAARHEGRGVQRLVAAICLATLFALAAASLAVREMALHTSMLRRRDRERNALVQTLEARVAARTHDLAEVNGRFELATNAAGVTVFVQRRDLTYAWINQSFREWTPDAIVGKTDYDLLPPHAAALLERKKRGVLETGEHAHLELHVNAPDYDVWYDISLIPGYGPHDTIAGIIGAAVDVTQRKQTEAHVRLLMREITHRAKNLLTVVLAMTRQTAASAASIEDFVARFSARLESLASSYDLLIKDDWHGTTIEELVCSQLSHHTDGDHTQISASGPRLRVPPDAAQNLGMALHELATNASKYGALSVPDGRVEVTWCVQPREDGGRDCVMCWREHGGPAVGPPARRGFGQVVIERSVARVLGGTVDLHYAPAGLQWRLTFPLPDQQGL